MTGQDRTRRLKMSLNGAMVSAGVMKIDNNGYLTETNYEKSMA